MSVPVPCELLMEIHERWTALDFLRYLVTIEENEMSAASRALCATFGGILTPLRATVVPCNRTMRKFNL